MDGVHLPYHVLAQVILRRFKLIKDIKTINGSSSSLKIETRKTLTFVVGSLTKFLSIQETKSLATHPLRKHLQSLFG